MSEELLSPAAERASSTKDKSTEISFPKHSSWLFVHTKLRIPENERTELRGTVRLSCVGPSVCISMLSLTTKISGIPTGVIMKLVFLHSANVNFNDSSSPYSLTINARSDEIGSFGRNELPLT